MLRQAVQQVLARGLSDPRLDGTMLTVTGVDLAPDLANVKFKVSVLPEKAQRKAVAALEHAAKHVRHQVSEILDLRETPAFHFELDISTKREAAVLAALAKAREATAPSVTGAEEESAEGESEAPAADRTSTGQAGDGASKFPFRPEARQ
ncbi:hypothetical protein BH11PLA1_BH11PLA1_22210 [soil metagenome]